MRSLIFFASAVRKQRRGMQADLSRSSNCASYTDTLSLFVGGKVSVKGKEDVCSVAVSTMSCQTSKFEAPDSPTRDGLLAQGRDKLRARSECTASDAEYVLEATTNLIGAQDTEYSPEKLVKLGMTSNCFAAGNDLGSATHIASAVCHPMEAMIDAKGQRVKNTNMKILSNLAVCDISDEAMPQVQEDLQKVAAYNSSVNGLKIQKPEDLACFFSVLPYV